MTQSKMRSEPAKRDGDTEETAGPVGPVTPLAVVGVDVTRRAPLADERRAEIEQRRAEHEEQRRAAHQDRRTAFEERRAAVHEERRRQTDDRSRRPDEDREPGVPSRPGLDDGGEDGIDINPEAMAYRPRRTAPVEDNPARRRRSWMLNIAVVLLPVLAAYVYLFHMASNVYQVDAVIAVRNPMNQGASMPNGIAGALGGAGAVGVSARAVDESYAVIRYAQSREAFDSANRQLNLRDHYANHEYSWFQRLPDDASYERFFRYYLQSVNIYYDDLEGKIILSTFGFDAQKTLAFATTLTKMSEELVNKFNERAQTDSVELAKKQAQKAEAELRRVNEDLTKFRIENQVIDPTSSSASLGSIITSLESQAAATQAEIRALSSLSQGQAPRLAELRNRLSGLYAQIQAEQSRLTGKSDALAPVMQRFNLLTAEQAVAQQIYINSLTSLDTTLLQVQREKLYVVNIVNPELPPEPRHPRRYFILAMTLLVSIVVCLILRLVIASIRDHMV